MDLIRTLGVAIDPSGAKTGAAAASEAFRNIGTAAEKTQRATERTRKEMDGAGASMAGVKRAGDILRETLDRQTFVLRKLDSSVRSLTKLLREKKSVMDAASTSTERMSRVSRKASDDVAALSAKTAAATTIVLKSNAALTLQTVALQRVGITAVQAASATHGLNSSLLAQSVVLIRLSGSAAAASMQLRELAAMMQLVASRHTALAGGSDRNIVNVTGTAAAVSPLLLMPGQRQQLTSLKELLGAVGLQARGASAAMALFRSTLLSVGSGVAMVLGPMALGMGAVMIPSAIMQTQMQVQRSRNALRFASGGRDEFALNEQFATGVSERFGLERLSATREFAKFMAAGRGSEFSGNQLRDIFLGVAQASTVLGLSADETAGAINALQQMISKGTVQAEELRGQLGERLPGAFNMAARAIGVSTQELNKMLDKGEVTAHRLLPALARELRRTFGPESQRAAHALQAEVNRLANSWTDFKDAVFNSEIGNFFTTFIALARSAVQEMTELVKLTGNLPFSKVGPLARDERRGRWWGRPPAFEPRLLDEFRYGGAAPRAEPWLLSQFSYGVARQPLSPELRSLIDELTLMPKPLVPVRGSLGAGTDRSLLGAFRYGLGDATREMRRHEEWDPKAEKWLAVRQVGQDTIRTLSDGFSTFFDDFIADTGNAEQAFRKMAGSILNDIARILTRRLIAEPIAMAIGGVLGLGGTQPVSRSHIGSIAGVTGLPTTLVDPWIFANAPRLHNGLAPDEFPAILQRGEAVITKNQVSTGAYGGGLTMNNYITVEGGGGESAEDNRALGVEIARQIEARMDERIVRAMGARGVLSRTRYM